MAAGLGQDALARIDQDHGQIRRRGPGDHIAGILLVTGGVGDDELAPVGREEAIGDIDGDALLALGGQSIDQKGEIDLAALGADALGVRLQSRHLIFEDHFGIIKQPPDQGGLAVIDTAAGDEAEQALMLMLQQIGVNIGADEIRDVGHQK